MKYESAPGHEVRGLMLRLYPTGEQEVALKEIEDALRSRWNGLCAPTEEVWEARKAHACRGKLVGRAPSPACFGRDYREQSLALGWCDPWPDYNGLTPEQAKAKKKALGEAMAAWWSSVH